LISFEGKGISQEKLKEIFIYQKLGIKELKIK
jgi:hypothetical protein